MRRYSRLVVLVLPVCFLFIQAANSEPIEMAVVKIFNYAEEKDWSSPWTPKSLSTSSGTGFIIEGGRILTNAHVVSWSKRLEIRRYLDPKPYTADIEFIGHDCDLAIVKPRDQDFFKGLVPLTIGDLPRLRSVVTTYGYPAGGQSLSSTKGVVSRIEYNIYVHPGAVYLLSVQTDAAINPGNSGGPVMQDGKVVGVAFQGIGNLENVGFFIPTVIIDHFLKDIGDGKYDGFPDLSIRFSNLENPAYRQLLRLPSQFSGVVIDAVLPKTPESKVLRPNDVIIDLSGRAVANDGTVVYKNHRIPFTIGIDESQTGDTLNMSIWRDDKRISVQYQSSVDAGRLRKLCNIYDSDPRYFIYGGLVFMPLDREYLKLFGSHWFQEADDELLYQFFELPLIDPNLERREIVVLSKTLPAPVNARLIHKENMVVDQIDGKRIESLDELIEVLSEKKELHIVRYTERGSFDVLNKEQMERSTPEILSAYGIKNDRQL